MINTNNQVPDAFNEMGNSFVTAVAPAAAATLVQQAGEYSISDISAAGLRAIAFLIEEPNTVRGHFMTRDHDHLLLTHSPVGYNLLVQGGMTYLGVVVATIADMAAEECLKNQSVVVREAVKCVSGIACTTLGSLAGTALVGGAAALSAPSVATTAVISGCAYLANRALLHFARGIRC